jgi:hypothetical protein
MIHRMLPRFHTGLTKIVIRAYYTAIAFANDGCHVTLVAMHTFMEDRIRRSRHDTIAGTALYYASSFVNF